MTRCTSLNVRARLDAQAAALADRYWRNGPLPHLQLFVSVEGEAVLDRCFGSARQDLWRGRARRADRAPPVLAAPTCGWAAAASRPDPCGARTRSFPRASTAGARRAPRTARSLQSTNHSDRRARGRALVPGTCMRPYPAQALAERAERGRGSVGRGGRSRSR